MASREPVDAPDGTAARPIAPDSSNTSHSTVGLPRESRISRPMISTIALIILTVLPEYKIRLKVFLIGTALVAKDLRHRTQTPDCTCAGHARRPLEKKKAKIHDRSPLHYNARGHRRCRFALRDPMKHAHTPVLPAASAC